MSKMGNCAKCKKYTMLHMRCEDCGSMFCPSCARGVKCQNCNSTKTRTL